MLNTLCALTQTYVQPIIESYKKDIKGATAIEYGLIAGGISLVIVASVFAFGSSLAQIFSTMETKMASAATKAQ